MITSVLVIAHNEAGNIVRCLESIQRQTLKPDEVILVAHNCTDGTIEIAEEFIRKSLGKLGITTWRVVKFNGAAGIIYARVRGFEEATGGIIACIDGDSVARKNWLQKITKPFSDPKILVVGGGVWLTGGLIPWLMSLDFFWLKPIYKPFLNKILRLAGLAQDDTWKCHFWGANFAIRKLVYEKIGGLIPFIQICKEIYKQDVAQELDPSTSLRTTIFNTKERRLGLSLAPEDLYLALRVAEVGEVAIEPRAVVVSPATKTNWKIRSQIQGKDKQKLIKYFLGSSEKQM